MAVQGNGLTRSALRWCGKLNSQQRDGRGAAARGRLMRAFGPCLAYLER
jgi:hypothetical protein